MARFAPALLLALSAAWCGTLTGGATAAGSAAFVLSLLGILAWIGTPWRDPLRLERAGRWLPVALWLWATVSAAASSVPRAGLVGLLLLPAFFGLPGAVARCWNLEEARWEGLRAVSGVVAAIALWGLLDRFLLDAPRAAMPIGHHNLLALWLATLLPLAVLPARERGPWRWLGIGAGLLALGAVLASRSLMGTAAVVVDLTLLFSPLPLAGEGPGGKDTRRRAAVVLAVLGVLAVLALFQAPRLHQILRGNDPSARARATYLEAGLEGFLARPLLGQGPGATAWTASLFLDPAPGVNPWGEAVGELHSLPLQVAYELGAPGVLLAFATAGWFVFRRLKERRGADDPGLLLAALCGLAGAAVALLGTASLAVTALPLALAVAAGAALAGGGEPAGRSDGSVRSDRSVRSAALSYATVAAVALSPFLLAQAHYDRALAADQAGHRELARQRLERAVRLDPAFPLYRLRLALLSGTGAAERSAAAELALRAAEQGHGLAPLWTVAGILGQVAERPWAPAALQTACSLDPLSPFPPWFGMLADPAGPRAARQGAHALLAEPRLAAAFFWQRDPALFGRALQEAEAWPGIDAVWTEAFLAAASRPGEWTGERHWLSLQLDLDPRASISLFTFRRRPWPAEWPVVPLAGGPLEKLRRVGSATSRPGIPASAFAPSICAEVAAKR